MALTNFLTSKPGKIVTIGLIVLALGVIVYVTFWPDDHSNLVADVNTQTWIDTDGNVFRKKLVAFEPPDAKGPNGKAAFRAELCYWTKEGKTKTEPTPVLLNSNIGKPEPTYCPDCGRLVTPLNAPPMPGIPDDQQRVPPLQGERATANKAEGSQTGEPTP